jgi:PilZ domain
MQTKTNKLFGIFNLFRRRATLPTQSSMADTVVSSSTTLLPGVTSAERRQAARRWGDPVQVFIWDGNPGSEKARGWIVNRSTGGLGLSAAQPVPEGTFLNVRVAVAPDSVAWTPIQLKSCTPATGRWILGCQFVETPPRETLLMFR